MSEERGKLKGAVIKIDHIITTIHTKNLTVSDYTNDQLTVIWPTNSLIKKDNACCQNNAVKTWHGNNSLMTSMTARSPASLSVL